MPVAIMLCLVGTPAIAAGAPASRTIRYSTAHLGATKAGFPLFRLTVATVLNDPQGWSLNGAVKFKEVPRGGSFVVTLAAPAVVGSYGGCSVFYSCRSGGRVLINDDRWRLATPTYGKALADYRRLVVNHEVGHALGFGHAYCRRPNGLAPVMQQQSKGLLGCRRNPWPLSGERRVWAARVGASIAAAPPGLVLGRRIGQVSPGLSRLEVTALLGSPNRRRGGRLTFRRDALGLRMRAGHVVDVETGSSRYRSHNGVSVGIATSRLLRRIPKATCVVAYCLKGRPHDRGDTYTVFELARHRVSRIRVSRYTADRRPSTRLEDAPVGQTTDAEPTIRFSSDDELATFECRLDGGRYSACDSPFRSAALSTGDHVFEVRALDVAGRPDRTPARSEFTVLSPTPPSPPSPTTAGH